MGYDMYRFTEAYSRPADPDGYEQMPLGEYFRLNIWGMGKARELALLGLAQPPIKEYELYVRATEEEKNILSSMSLQQKFWNVHAPSNDDPSHLSNRWIGSVEQFSWNGVIATAENCSVFAECLNLTITYLEENQLEIPEWLPGFIAWLESCNYGALIG